MSDSKALEKLTDLAQTELPEVFYGRNHVYAVLPAHDFLLEVCPVESISLSSFAKREKTLSDTSSREPVTVKSADGLEGEFRLNKVDVVPKSI